MEVAEAYKLISRAIDSGHAAHGYLVVGEVGGNCHELTQMVLKKLFPEDVRQIESASHPDVAILESEGKARIITVEAMREKILEPMSTTAFSGGWKVGVVCGADRMRQESANAFLKSLEEPPPKTMYFLLTDQPDAILPTIVSRTQRIDLKLPAGTLDEEDFAEVEDAFAAKDVERLVAKLKELKDSAADEEVAYVRKAFYKTLMEFARKMMVGGKIPRYRAFGNIEAIEEAYRRSERSLNDDAVVSYMMDRMAFE